MSFSKRPDGRCQAAIKGLLSLQQQQNSLSDKHLRPLEDNPLRLDMDYATALNVMFAEGKSPVHLAAPAAIAESLAQHPAS